MAPQSTFLTLHLPLASLSESGTQSQQVQFLDNTPVDETAGRYWARLMRMAYREATAHGSSLASPLIRAHLVRSLVDAALTVFPNSTMTSQYIRGSGQVGPMTLQRAVEHMHAHAARPLTITQIAEVAGISARACRTPSSATTAAPP